MSFTSYTYLLFLAAAAILVRLTSGKARENVLLGASLLFYAVWDVRYLAVLLPIGVLTYLAGHAVARDRKSLAVVLWPIAIILVVLGVFKYSAMVAELVSLALPAKRRLTLPALILPLGISFFTFECISYLLDLHKGGKELLPLRRFLLFPAFWAHMVAGPILRIKEFVPQLDALKTARSPDVLMGVDRILIGFAKKLIVANSLSGFVDQGFAGAGGNSALDNWILALAFGLQVYFDFSSYTDIAIGSAKMVGFTFPENFNLPYHASTPTDFWNRWHMTLSRWIRDYLFFPLNLRAGKRIWLRYVTLVVVMTLVGLWHGAGLGFVLWGTWHGVLLVAHRLVQGKARDLPGWAQTALDLVGRGATLALVNAAWILFRAPTVRQAFAMLSSMFRLRGLKPAYSVNDYILVLFAIAVYLGLEPLFKRHVDRDPATIDYARWTFWLRPLTYSIALWLIFMYDRSNVAFIYFQF
ncbi:MAG: MBOAT family O-acyltransferase [Byssovorax sp.]